MKIAFADVSPDDYTIAAVLQRPLGGSESAACYLAPALAKLGHSVAFITNTSTPATIQGVSCLSWNQMQPEVLRQQDFDAVIALFAPEALDRLRSCLPPKTKLFLWTQHAHDQPAVEDLHNPAVRDLLDAFILVSDWQSQQFQSTFGIPANKIAILRNAVAPPFLNLFPPGQAVLPGKSEPPILAHTSTPFRGLDILLHLFPMIADRIPGVRLQIFSSMMTYGLSEAADQQKYGHLYDLARATPGIEYIGAIPQPELAQALRKVSLLTYPNSFRETSCIAIMEAMAAGCHIITTDLAALPETTAGFATLITPDPATYGTNFLNLTVELLLNRTSTENESRRRAQVDYIHRECTWHHRAEQWQFFLQQALIQ